MYKKISKLPNKLFRHILVLPVIWAVSVPILILDIFTEIYQHIAFPLCGIPIVKRSNYIKIDRQKLAYLNFGDKLGCMYCGYANGFAAYFVKIAGDTEKYWCGIKHQETAGFIPQPHQKDFLPYGDEQAYKDFLKKP
jgi:hypothetical protein